MWNEKALNDADLKYSASMEDWLEETTSHTSSEELTEHHLEVQHTGKDNLKSALKGPNEITNPFITRFINVPHLFT